MKSVPKKREEKKKKREENKEHKPCESMEWWSYRDGDFEGEQGAGEKSRRR